MIRLLFLMDDNPHRWTFCLRQFVNRHKLKPTLKSHNIISAYCAVTYRHILRVPRPHQCSGYRCPPCHQDTVHTLYPEASPCTSLLGGRGWAHRRDEAASHPSLRREKITNPVFQLTWGVQLTYKYHLIQIVLTDLWCISFIWWYESSINI